MSEPTVRCAIYTRKSTTEGLEQDFNTLDAQRESAEQYIASQAGEGWVCLPDRYDDGGFSGGNMDRPALKRLLADIDAGEIDCVVVYKIDRLSRSLADFARIAETLEEQGVSFVAVTQQFNSSTSMGRLMMNVLLSFAQFEREIISERTRDKIAATRRKGKWSGGRPLLGYDIDRSRPGAIRLVVNDDEAERVRRIFELYLEHGSLMPVVKILNERGWRAKRWVTKKGIEMGGRPFEKGSLFKLLTNIPYLGKVTYKSEVHEGEHDAIVPEDIWRKVQVRLQRNGRSGSAEARNKHGALLRGLLHCGPCACAMTHAYTQKRDRLYRYYVCAKAQKQGWHTCPSKSVPAGEIERFVVDQIRCIGRDPSLVAETLKQTRRQAEEGIRKLDKERGIVERELKRDHAALRKATDPARLADLHDRMQMAERCLQEIREQVGALRDGMVGEDEIRATLAEFDDLWASFTPKEQARIIQLLVGRIEYDGRAGTVSITFRPSGVRALEGEIDPLQPEVAA